MAPNKRGGPPSAAALADAPLAEGSVISAAEVAARGSGTAEEEDTYASATLGELWRSEKRVFFTGTVLPAGSSSGIGLAGGADASSQKGCRRLQQAYRQALRELTAVVSSDAGLMFLTRLPCPGWCDHSPPFLMRSMMHFPVLGAAIGFWGAVFFNAAALLFPPAVAAAASTLATVHITGCFHEDGLADVFDGFGGGWGRVQILRIMKDSRVGTYALVGMLLVLHMKLHALAAFEATSVGAVLIAAHCASRWTSVPLLYCCKYIQDEEDAKKGLYNWFAQSQRLLTLPRLLFSTGTAMLVPLAVLGLHKAVIVWATVLLVTIASAYYGTAIIGGVVGDYLGATIQICELMIYLALLADWSVLSTGHIAWKPIALLFGTATLPIMYSRRIVDFGAKEC